MAAATAEAAADHRIAASAPCIVVYQPVSFTSMHPPDLLTARAEPGVAIGEDDICLLDD